MLKLTSVHVSRDATRAAASRDVWGGAYRRVDVEYCNVVERFFRTSWITTSEIRTSRTGVYVTRQRLTTSMFANAWWWLRRQLYCWRRWRWRVKSKDGFNRVSAYLASACTCTTSSAFNIKWWRSCESAESAAAAITQNLHLVYLHQYQNIYQINTMTHRTNLLIAPTLSYVTTYTSKSSNTRWGSLPRHHNSDYWLFDFQNAASVRLDDSKAVHKGYCSMTLTLPAQKSPGDYRSPNTSQIFDNSSIFVCTMQTARKSLQVAVKLLTDNHIT